MRKEDEVGKVSEDFYAALNRMANGDAGSMKDCWSHGAEVTAMHPIGGRHEGWEAVRGSFAQVAKLAKGGKIELQDQLIRVAGDMAYELGVERGTIMLTGEQVAIEQRVTNIYRRDGGAWKLNHHHTDISPTMLDVISRLPAGE